MSGKVLINIGNPISLNGEMNRDRSRLNDEIHNNVEKLKQKGDIMLAPNATRNG